MIIFRYRQTDRTFLLYIDWAAKNTLDRSTKAQSPVARVTEFVGLAPGEAASWSHTGSLATLLLAHRLHPSDPLTIQVAPALLCGAEEDWLARLWTGW